MTLHKEQMLEMFMYEAYQSIDQLEQSLMEVERSGRLEMEQVHLIFRIMHTIKGSSAMMMFQQITDLAHQIEDLFHYLREHAFKLENPMELTDLVLTVSDSIKKELSCIEQGMESAASYELLIGAIQSFIKTLREAESQDDLKISTNESALLIDTDAKTAAAGNKQYEVTLKFAEDCGGMENIRCYSAVNNLQEIAEVHSYAPEDILVNHEGSTELIRRNGFQIHFSTVQDYEAMLAYFSNIAFIYEVKLDLIEEEQELQQEQNPLAQPGREPSVQLLETQNKTTHFISVNIEKMDKLMDLVGELVISEAMVTEHPELKKLELEQFVKAARQLRKITGELQDVVMSIRMVPLSGIFQKMNRIVRDMSRKLDKEIRLTLIGQETEVDKSICDQLSDPIMHMIRNCMDHGIEPSQERIAAGKAPTGSVTLEARNVGSEVWIIIRDDGRGLHKENILRKANEAGLLKRPVSEYTEREIYSMIFFPGFSTKQDVTEFSGRGVGMDVVNQNIQKLSGSIHVESEEGRGTAVTLKIPLTLAIIDGMTFKVGESCFTVPTGAIRESFRVKAEEIVRDPEGNEMIFIRGNCYKMLRIHEHYRLPTEITDLEQGIMIMVEHDSQAICLFADQLLGKQQVVVKALPPMMKKSNGISGCTLLGDGSISLILEISDFMQLNV